MGTTELVAYEQFGRLRLVDFYPGEIDQLDDWEYMDGLWTGEAVGFTTFLRPYTQSYSLGAVTLDLVDLPPAVAAIILKRLNLPLSAGMSIDQISRILGAPTDILEFVPDRKTYEFAAGQHARYQVFCTVHDTQGLIFLDMIREDMIPEELDEDEDEDDDAQD